MTNLIYNKNITDFSICSNLMLIDAQIYDAELFYSSVNSSTFAIKYDKVQNNLSDLFESNTNNNPEIISNTNINDETEQLNIDLDLIYDSKSDTDINYIMSDIKNENINYINNLTDSNLNNSILNNIDNIDNTFELTQKEQITKLLETNNFNNLKRICIVCDDTNIEDYKEFLDSEAFFTSNDLDDLQQNQTYSENLEFLIDLLNHYNITNIDFILCNSLKYPNWNKYYQIIKSNTSAIIGASNDQTGNPEAGGDWIMENTNENIKFVYFTNLIDSYKSTLIATNLTNSQSTNSQSTNSNLLNIFGTNNFFGINFLYFKKMDVSNYYILNTFVNKKTKFFLRQNDLILHNFYYKILKYPKEGKIIKFDKKNGKVTYLSSPNPGNYYIKYTCVTNDYLSSKYILSNYKIKIIIKKN